MKKVLHFLTLSFLFLTCSLAAKNNENSGLGHYHLTFPRFCKQHLLERTEECFECDFDGNLRDKTSSEFYLEREDLLLLEEHDLPALNQKCGLLYCHACSSFVKMSLYRMEEPYESCLEYTCDCLPDWVSLKTRKKEYKEIIDNWGQCENDAECADYYNFKTKGFYSNFSNFLAYRKQNPTCNCYLPKSSKLAREISNLQFSNFHFYCYLYPILEEICSLNLPEFCGMEHASRADLAARLFLHCFWWSDYHRSNIFVIDALEKTSMQAKDTTAIANTLFLTMDQLQGLFVELYSSCLQAHPHPKVYYERGMVYYHKADFSQSLFDIQKFLEMCPKEDRTSDVYCQEGSAYNNCGKYDLAVQSLTRACP